jgi:hypothetical protein
MFQLKGGGGVRAKIKMESFAAQLMVALLAHAVLSAASIQGEC